MIAEHKDALWEQLLVMRHALETRAEATTQDAQPVSVDQPIGRLTRMDAMQQQQMALGQQQWIKGKLQQGVDRYQNWPAAVETI